MRLGFPFPQTAAETILGRIQPNATRLSYSFENWLFHYIAEGGVVYLCAADGEMGRRLPFAFLSEVQKQVRRQSGGLAFVAILTSVVR